jgi:hypothetical protein
MPGLAKYLRLPNDKATVAADRAMRPWDLRQLDQPGRSVTTTKFHGCQARGRCPPPGVKDALKVRPQRLVGTGARCDAPGSCPVSMS